MNGRKNTSLFSCLLLSLKANEDDETDYKTPLVFRCPRSPATFSRDGSHEDQEAPRRLPFPDPPLLAGGPPPRPRDPPHQRQSRLLPAPPPVVAAAAEAASRESRPGIAAAGLAGGQFVDSSLRLICCEELDGRRWQYVAEGGEASVSGRLGKGSFRAVSLQSPQSPAHDIMSFVRSYVVPGRFS
ncbi:hypothetical protein NL676_039752 [Syzygium grande]|nr:hypothetical protein NL676_039752 [Syzygium grande]